MEIIQAEKRGGVEYVLPTDQLVFPGHLAGGEAQSILKAASTSTSEV